MSAEHGESQRAVGELVAHYQTKARAAQLYHRMAEQARLQLQLEERVSENDQRMGQLLTALTARAAAAARAQAAPSPQPTLVQPHPQQIAAPYPQLRRVAASATPSSPPVSPPPAS